MPVSISSFSWNSKINIHESGFARSAQVIGSNNFGPLFDTSIRYFGDGTTGTPGSNPSKWESVGFDDVNGWPFTPGTNGTTEFQAYKDGGNGITVDNIKTSAMAMQTAVVGDSPWMSLELFNSQLPIAWTAYNDYPLWSPSRIICGFRVRLDANINGTIQSIKNARLDFTVLEQLNWPTNGIRAEIYLAEVGTSGDASWNTKDGTNVWDQTSILPTPFDNNTLGGHSALGAQGGGAIEHQFIVPGRSDGVQFIIPPSLPDDIISINVTQLIEDVYVNSDYSDSKDIVFLIRAAYWPDTNGPLPIDPTPPAPPATPIGGITSGSPGSPSGGPTVLV